MSKVIYTSGGRVEIRKRLFGKGEVRVGDTKYPTVFPLSDLKAVLSKYLSYIGNTETQQIGTLAGWGIYFQPGKPYSIIKAGCKSFTASQIADIIIAVYGKE